MVVYVAVSGSLAGEIKIREGVRGVNLFGGPGEGARVNIGESKLGGNSAEATPGGVDVKVEHLH